MNFVRDLFHPIWLVFWLPLLLLGVPVGIKRKSFFSFVRALVTSGIGIVIPFGSFLLSAFLVPSWKGESPIGWFACFSVGKLWLLPLVVWAASAFYVRVVWVTPRPTQTWIVLGYVAGALVSDFCLVWALICHYGLLVGIWPFVVPIASAIYYTVTARRLLAESGGTNNAWGVVASGSIPLWAVSIWQSFKTFDSLPDQQPAGCFIVTAAMRGHTSIVGQPMIVTRRGRERLANQQLMTFWTFEDVWQLRSPRSHRVFRSLYNRIGPLVARQIKNKLLADTVFLALKPVEWVARRSVM